MSVALPADVQLSVHDTLTSLEMGLLPIRQFEGVSGAQYRNPSDPELRLDFVTCAHRRSEALVVLSELGLALQPLKFMEFPPEGKAALLAMAPDLDDPRLWLADGS